MTQLADIFTEYRPAYIQKHGARMLPSHKKVMKDVIACRTESMGGETFLCKKCGECHYAYHSCKNRHCPKCQNDDIDQWLEDQFDLLLPVPYFMATFTLPEGLRSVARSHQKQFYNILFRTSAEALQTLAADKRFVGGSLGMMGVLQTWTRELNYHPHLHYLIPGGGLSPDGKKWKKSKGKLLMHVRPLAILFRAKFRDALKKACLYDQVPKKVWRQVWVVNIIPVGTGEAALKYLAPYVFRSAISNNNILSVKDGRVTFRFKESKTNQYKRMTVSVMEFMRRFLQHVLPRGFVKVRYYGLFSSQKRALLSKVKELLGKLLTLKKRLVSSKTKKEYRCPKCGGQLVFLGKLPRKRGQP